MHTSASAAVKIIPSAANLLVEVLNSFVGKLELRALILVCFLLFLFFKFGIRNLVMGLGSTNLHSDSSLRAYEKSSPDARRSSSPAKLEIKIVQEPASNTKNSSLSLQRP